MSEGSPTPDLVELLRGPADALHRRDFDALIRFFAPNAVWDATRTLGVALRGRVAIRDFVEDWLAAYEEFEYLPQQPLDLGNGVLFAVVEHKARPVGVSGFLKQRVGWVFVWVKDLIVSVTVYPEPQIDEARAGAERLAR